MGAGKRDLSTPTFMMLPLKGTQPRTEPAAFIVYALAACSRHVSNILARTGLANRAEAVAYAKRNGLT